MRCLSSLRADKRPRLFRYLERWRSRLAKRTVGPRRNRGTTARTGIVHVTGGFSSPSPRVPGPPKDVHRGRWSRFQAVAVRTRRLRRRKGGSRGWFVRLTIIRTPLRVWCYFNVADYLEGVLCAAVLARGHVTSKRRTMGAQCRGSFHFSRQSALSDFAYFSGR